MVNALLSTLLACSLASCTGDNDGDYKEPDPPDFVPSGKSVCSKVLADYGHGEANYEAAMLDHPTCIGDEGTETLYYQFLDDRDIKYPGWPN